MPAWTPPSEWMEEPLKAGQPSHRRSSSTPMFPSPAQVFSTSPSPSSPLEHIIRHEKGSDDFEHIPFHEKDDDDLKITPAPPQRPFSYNDAAEYRGGIVAETVIVTQIDDTVGVMRENINKVSQRGERLDSLQDKTDNLAVSAQGFRRGANRVRKQMWLKDFKMRICIIVGIIALLLVIIIPSVIAAKRH
ncbi:MAG: hypothetical protein MMC33_006549 [Icmadophila ericetorum]|nr:hypothetical protein [Icmadophila ericetorum]